MKIQTNAIKLIALFTLLAGGFALRELPGVFAHEGHKKGHAPAKAKKARNPVERNTANIENGKALQKAGFSPAPNPAKPGSFSPHLSITPEGKFLLSWVEPAGGKAQALKYAIHQAGRWSAPRTVTASEEVVRSPSMPPVITMLPGNRLIACWTQERRVGKGKWSPEDFHFSVSRDGGATWSKPRIVHGDLSEGGHNYASVAPTGADEITAVWLDAREWAKTGKKVLMAAKIKTDGTVSEEKMIDADVCPCCPTTLAKASNGLIAAYRDHEGETRDISFLRFSNGQWGEPQNLHRDGWKINGCPVNAAALVADGQRVVAAWFTAANDKPAVKAAFSSDGGRTFGQPLILSPDSAIGRPAVTMFSDGTAVVAWVKNVGGSSQLVINRIKPDGSISAPTMLGKAGKSFPRIARAGQQVIVAWTDPAGVVKTVVVNGQIENQPVGSFTQ